MGDRVPAREGPWAKRAMDRLYGRIGSRMMFVYVGGSVVAGVVASAVGWAAGARLIGLSFSQAASVYALTLPTLLVFGLAGLAASIGRLRTILAWHGGGDSREAAIETWEALVSLREGVLWAAVLASVGLIPFAVYVTIRFSEPAWGVVILFLAPASQLAALWVFLVALGDLLARPMLEDVARHLPEDFEPRIKGMRLGLKALAPLPLVTFFAAGIVGAYGNLGAKGIDRLTIVFGIGLGTVVVATLIYLIINRSVLAPIDDLIAATRRVRAGDLSSGVPVVTADELGTLAHNFNDMIDGLRDREALRDEVVRRAKDLRASRERIVAAADAERRRVERDLHDGAQQHLILLKLKLAMAERMIEQDPVRAKELHAELQDDLARALTELRDLAHGIYPPLLESDGLPGALGEAVRLAAIPTELECDSAGRYRPELEAAVYFCCLEALQNAAKHAGEGARARVRIAQENGALRFEVRDDGRGFSLEGAGRSSGIQNMTDRIGALGGTLVIDSAEGAGTTVAGAIPLER